MGKLLQREKRNDLPTEKNWSAPLGRLKDLLYYATHRWEERRRQVIAPSQHDRHDITAPTRKHHVNRMNGDESTFPILVAEFTMMKIQWIIKTLQTSLMGELEGKSIVLPQTFLVDEWWDWWPCKNHHCSFFSIQNSSISFFFFLFFILLWRYWSKAKRTIQRAKANAEDIIQRNKEYFKPKQQTVVDNIYPVNDRRR